MILLITPSANGQQCADSLYAATGQETHWAQTLQAGSTRLREQTYSAAVIDQFLLETEPEESDQMIEHLGTAFPVYLNFGVTGMERLVREVRSALHRRRREEGAARRAVAEQMHSQMSETLTAMRRWIFMTYRPEPSPPGGPLGRNFPCALRQHHAA